MKPKLCSACKGSLLTPSWKFCDRPKCRELRMHRLIKGTLHVVRIDTCPDGIEVVTLEDENGQLDRTLRKLVPKKLLDAYKGEVYNKYNE